MRAEKWKPWKLAAAVLGAALALVVGPGVSAAQANSSIIPPDSPTSATFGKTYAEWSASWWQWSLGISVHKPPFSGTINHPLFDTTGAQCSVGQTGPVWFLGGALFQTGTPATSTITRDGCTVPNGVGLFLPVINIECSTLEGPAFGCGPAGATVDQLRADIAPVIDKAAQLEADVDGRRLDTALNPTTSAYRTLSPAFGFSLPPDDMLTAIGEGPFHPGNYSPAVGDGVYILVAPLSSGQHTIHFHGAIPSFKFVLDVTYHLTVA